MIYGEIYKLETMHGWVYNGCAKCGTKPRIDDRGMMCSGCKKPPENLGSPGMAGVRSRSRRFFGSKKVLKIRFSKTGLQLQTTELNLHTLCRPSPPPCLYKQLAKPLLYPKHSRTSSPPRPARNSRTNRATCTRRFRGYRRTVSARACTKRGGRRS